jgi:hypothetical protein
LTWFGADERASRVNETEFHLANVVFGAEGEVRPKAFCCRMHLAAKEARRLDSPELVIEYEKLNRTLIILGVIITLSNEQAD